jgi:catechol 2,3-dioxygenase-like lactoylglutathione lyase family enzyme
MIQKMSHATIYVLDQDQARDFYVGKLGFEVKVDQSLPNGFPWLTVAPKGQSNLEIILMKVGAGTNFIKTKGGEAGKSDTQDIDTMASLLKKGMVQRRRVPDGRLPQNLRRAEGQRGRVRLRTERAVLRRGGGFQRSVWQLVQHVTAEEPLMTACPGHNSVSAPCVKLGLVLKGPGFSRPSCSPLSGGFSC